MFVGNVPVFGWREMLQETPIINLQIVPSIHQKLGV
jgi:hypothetical protein